MELRQLGYFTTLAEVRHFGRAAARLHVSTSGLSQQIRALERRLGAALFVRTPTGVHLTPAGEYLLGAAQELLQAAEVAAAGTRAIHESGPAGRFSLLVDADVAMILDETIAAFAAEHPEIGVSLETVGQKLLHERSSVTFNWHLALSWTAPPRLTHRNLIQVPVKIAVGAEHPLMEEPGRTEVTRPELATYPLILFDRGEARELFDHVMQDLERSPSQPHIAAGPVTGPAVPLMLRRLRTAPRDAFTIAPPQALSCGSSGGLVGLDLEPSSWIPVKASWPGPSPHPLTEAFLDFVSRHGHVSPASGGFRAAGGTTNHTSRN